MIVDPGGKHFKLNHYRYKFPDPPHEIPGNFREIVRTAEKLGKGLDYIRVDMYNTTKGIALGEMTIYPYGGGMNIPTGCPIFDPGSGINGSCRIPHRAKKARRFLSKRGIPSSPRRFRASTSAASPLPTAC